MEYRQGMSTSLEDIKAVKVKQEYNDEQSSNNCSGSLRLSDYFLDTTNMVKVEANTDLEFPIKLKQETKDLTESCNIGCVETVFCEEDERNNALQGGFTEKQLKCEIDDLHKINKECDQAFPGIIDKNINDIAFANCKTFKCIKKCSQSFSDQQSLKIHFDTVHNNFKMFQCNACLAILTSKQNLKVHISYVHLRRKMYRCRKCKKSFQFENQLMYHLNIFHANKNKIQCNECSAILASKRNLKIHMDAIHLQNKRYACSACEMVFAYNIQLIHHNDIFHRNIVKFQCNECLKVYANKHNMKRHIEAIHLRNKKIICSECNKTFTYKDHLDRHIFNVHSKHT